MTMDSTVCGRIIRYAVSGGSQKAVQATHLCRAAQRAAFLLLFALACSPGTQPDAPGDEPAATAVVAGIDVLLEERLDILGGKRVGLITNHTGRTADGRSTIDVLAASSAVQLVALFGPEHGLRGIAEAGERVDSSVDSATGLPIRSLYGETRAPSADMLADVDVLVFDIQDIGTRYYTYAWTMVLSMQAAAANGKAFVVLDRPNPIGGERVDGNVLDPEFASFVGLYPVPMRHGLTVGELAMLVNREFRVNADLTVIPMRGWMRTAWYDSTMLQWVAPSPNMPSLESAAHYPGTCLFEGTNLSVGRGTAEAFRHIGAPWLDHGTLLARINAHTLPGIRFDTTSFTPQAPGDDKYDGELLHGIRFTVTDRAQYDPAATAVVVLDEIRRLHPDSFQFRDAGFDRLAGTDRLRLDLLAGVPPAAIVAAWEEARDRFVAMREPYLMYR